MSTHTATTLVLLLATAAPVAAQEVRFEGTLNFLQDRDADGNRLPERQITYPPLADAEIISFRHRPLISCSSDGSGFYKMMVPSGSPIILLFDGNGELKPELKMLTADPSKPQYIHVTLLTYRQFAEQFGREALVSDLEKLIRILRKMEGFDTTELEERIKKGADVGVSREG